MTRVLGIDPGSRVTGYGVIETDGVRSRHLASGCIRTAAGDFPARLGEIFHGVREVLVEWRPQQVAVEQVFVSRNAASALKLGQARGAAISAVVTLDLQVFEYTPAAVKQGLVGNGRAEKEQVQHMVRVILGLQGKMALDESDALAVALCHAHSHATRRQIEAAQ
ncbi:MAG: crossover junction endodeoxyribonuclease RuvC [Chromatiaceae bacterium]|nr:crossover junction endodeoxyribonuclease RuvC [Gammaproteobacteria bacterium]MCP5318977.1 crossover junction endodeoxyribonuclease RuvC [Chromatiaceae bacterium]MCP5430356.1 crossover junction endodeoxyribonuclease RuvC [Chromatiaceae bacterium]MCP5436311.1 crossover junction endodeoxyribonuclease RuvC [Chromatiaceae bacterium]HOP18258.1 crossover junction endodeoxyribonuclease RuvC [Gammaproteobacteria bacterium]